MLKIKKNKLTNCFDLVIINSIVLLSFDGRRVKINWNFRFLSLFTDRKSEVSMPPTILIVERNLDLAESIQNVLIAYDYSCIAVGYGSLESVLTKLNSILLVICGIELIIADKQFRHQIQAIVSANSASVIFTIGSHMPEGMQDSQVLQKPFSVETLLTKVQRHLALTAMSHQSDRASQALATLSIYEQNIQT